MFDSDGEKIANDLQVLYDKSDSASDFVNRARDYSNTIEGADPKLYIGYILGRVISVTDFESERISAKVMLDLKEATEFIATMKGMVEKSLKT